MGNQIFMDYCCPVSRIKNRDKDLPSPVIEGNEFQKFELSFPFSRTLVDTFEKRLRLAADKTKKDSKGDGSTVTIESLREFFITPAWEGEI